MLALWKQKQAELNEFEGSLLYLSLNPKKAIPGLPTALEDFTDMGLFSLSAEQNVKTTLSW